MAAELDGTISPRPKELSPAEQYLLDRIERLEWAFMAFCAVIGGPESSEPPFTEKEMGLFAAKFAVNMVEMRKDILDGK